MSVVIKHVLLIAAACAATACSRGSDGAPAPSSATLVALEPGDVERGRRAFGLCRSCHAVEPGVHRVGPSLFGVSGRRAGTVDGYAYSEAMAESGLTWSPEALDAYLENPRKSVIGTKMSFAGVEDAQRRADIVAYLDTMK